MKNDQFYNMLYCDIAVNAVLGTDLIHPSYKFKIKIENLNEEHTQLQIKKKVQIHLHSWK